MSRWLESLILALALALVFAQEDEKYEKLSFSTGDEQNGDAMKGGMHLDHDTFLGDYVKGFREMNEEERAKKLEELVNKEIDTDKDGLVSVEELREHLARYSKMYRQREMESILREQDDDKDGKLSWEEFVKHTFGGDEDESLKDEMTQDKKKFAHADENGDSLLSNEEYHAFYHPMDNERMTEYTVNEHMGKYDTDKDGFVSYEEFKATLTDAEDESIKRQLKKDFDENHDKDKDGKLNRQEVKGWAVPEDAYVNDQPPKLLSAADDDKDGKLSPAEIAKHINLFLDRPVNEEQEEAGYAALAEESEDDKSEKHDEL